MAPLAPSELDELFRAPVDLDDVYSEAIEAWDNDYGTQDGIIWDRTGHTDDDGEWGNELFEWVGHLDDVRAAAKRAGFEVGEFVTQTIDGETEVFATATR